MNSIYRRNFIMTAGLLFFSFALMATAFTGLSYRYTIQETQSTLEENTRELADLTGQIWSRNLALTDADMANYLAFFSSACNADLLICDEDGGLILLCEYDNTDESASGSISPAVIEQMKTNGIFSGMDNLSVYGHRRFVVGAPIYLNSTDGEPSDTPKTIYGYLFMTASAKNLTEMWQILFQIFALVMAAVLLITFLCCSFFSRQLSRPLNELTDVVIRFGMGEYDLRCNVSTHTAEVKKLEDAFNTMADSIATAEQQRKEFVANISHELKTPMTTISGFSDGILDGTIPPARQQAALETISSETRRLSRLVRQMLDMSRMQSRDTNLVQTQFNLNETMATVLISLERKINSKQLQIDARFPDSDVLVWGVPDSITQVCYNLMDNAIKFSRPGGRLVVSIVPKGVKAHISISDEGETIPPEELNAIFDRFHKSDRSRSLDKEGVGLGLYIVKTILNNHKESISVASENGVTTFTFTLTLAE